MPNALPVAQPTVQRTERIFLVFHIFQFFITGNHQLKVKLIFEAAGCQEPGLLSVWKSLT